MESLGLSIPGCLCRPLKVFHRPGAIEFRVLEVRQHMDSAEGTLDQFGQFRRYRALVEADFTGCGTRRSLADEGTGGYSGRLGGLNDRIPF